MKKSLNIIDATKELNIIRSQKGYKSPFKAVGTYRLIDDGLRPEATVIIKTEKRQMHEASTGKGPVDALANVLTKSLSSIFPVIKGVKLVDFSSRIHDSRAGTAAKVEVNIIFTDGDAIWSVVAISENINMASFMALLDGFEYAIFSKSLYGGIVGNDVINRNRRDTFLFGRSGGWRGRDGLYERRRKNTRRTQGSHGST